MFSATNEERIIEYVPHDYEPRSIANIYRRLRTVRAEGERLGLRDGWSRQRIEQWIADRGLTPAENRKIERSAMVIGWDKTAGNVAFVGGLRLGEEYTGRPAILIFSIGTPPLQRLTSVMRLWRDIELAIGGST
jgi:hypothetical protein